MSENCTHDCSNCGENCSSRREEQSFLAPCNSMSNVKKVIGIVSGKGGVGKSTTVVNLSAYLGSRGYKVLCVDFDPQGNSTTGFGIKKRNVEISSYNLIVGKNRVNEAVIVTEFQNVSVIPATEALAGAEMELINMVIV